MHSLATLFLLGALGLVACSNEYTVVVPATTLNAIVASVPTATRHRAEYELKPHAMSAALSNEDAFDGIAEASCSRQASCDTIGNGQYGTEQSCRADMRSRATQQLAARCSGGIDRDKLETCIGALDVQPCGNPLDGFRSPSACLTLCSR